MHRPISYLSYPSSTHVCRLTYVVYYDHYCDRTKDTRSVGLPKVAEKTIASSEIRIDRIMAQRAKVIELYKTLLYMGRDYPKGHTYFRTNLKKIFMKNKNETDPQAIEKMIGHGEFVIKELEALYMLRKYRTLKRRYYP